MTRCVGKHRQLPRALDLLCERALVLGAGSRDPSRRHLARFGDEEPQGLHILVRHREVLVRAEAANLATLEHALLLGRLSRLLASRSPQASLDGQRRARRPIPIITISARRTRSAVSRAMCTDPENPAGAAWLDLQTTAYTAHPYRNPIIGWKSDMALYNTRDAIAFHQKYYNPANTVCVLVGDVTVEDARRLTSLRHSSRVKTNVSYQLFPQPDPGLFSHEYEKWSSYPASSWL